MLRKTVPDPYSGDWKSSVAVGREAGTGNRQFVRRSGTQTKTVFYIRPVLTQDQSFRHLHIFSDYACALRIFTDCDRHSSVSLCHSRSFDTKIGKTDTLIGSVYKDSLWPNIYKVTVGHFVFYA